MKINYKISDISYNRLKTLYLPYFFHVKVSLFHIVGHRCFSKNNTESKNGKISTGPGLELK